MTAAAQYPQSSSCALQCLNAIPELAAYFLEGALEGRGSRARLAAAYSDLVRQMWSGREGTVVQARK